MEKAGRLVFLRVPRSLGKELAGNGFCIDPNIPIPAEIASDAQSLADLSFEMIAAGMTRFVTEDPGHKDSDYYRRFVLALKPDIRGHLVEAARFKAGNRDYRGALEIADALQALFPEDPAVLLTRARILEGKAEALGADGDADEEAARAAYERVLGCTPPLPDGLFNAGFFFMKERKSQNIDRAKKCFTAYLSCEKNGRAKRGAVRRALSEIEDQSLEDPSFQEARALILRGDPAAGLGAIRAFLERFPLAWKGWFVLGWGLRLLGRWEDGAAAFRKALELGGRPGDLRNELAICLMESGDLRGARAELEACLREEPENVKILSNLGVLSLKKGDRTEAAGFFRTALEIEPDDPVARAYFSR
ncbi:MAG: tetratricopeptide repeat protein [Spirochaetaceae bacterium]|jgi:tetratricopeptide (TPR) repeat protein|nr:tetratricopeptide repeat protein [Spirochaetaceae bacterium]